MPDWKKTPPDFSAWPLQKRESIFYSIGGEDFRRRPFGRAHEGALNWLGYIDIYEDEKGVLAGQDFVFFGRHRILKFWGLRGEERYAFFAVFAAGHWQSFPRKFFEPAISALAPMSDPILIIGSRVLIKDLKRASQLVLEITVWRGD